MVPDSSLSARYRSGKMITAYRKIMELRCRSCQSNKAPFMTSEIVGLILAMDSCEKSLSTLCQTSWVFSGDSSFLPQGKLGRINIVRKIIFFSVLVKYKHEFRLSR